MVHAYCLTPRFATAFLTLLCCSSATAFLTLLCCRFATASACFFATASPCPSLPCCLPRVHQVGDVLDVEVLRGDSSTSARHLEVTLEVSAFGGPKAIYLKVMKDGRDMEDPSPYPEDLSPQP